MPIGKRRRGPNKGKEDGQARGREPIQVLGGQIYRIFDTITVSGTREALNLKTLKAVTSP